MSKQICEIRESDIHGKGVFALCDIKQGTLLFETHMKDLSQWDDSWINLTPNCLYNHSKTKANCLSQTNGKWKILVADKDIKQGEELLVDYTKDTDLEQPREDWEK